MGMSENKTSPQSFRRPTAVATLVLIAGAAASVAINVKAISLGHAPEAGAYVSGIAWPLALFGAIELLVHTPWAKSKSDQWIKGAVLIIVAGVAAWVSYWHGAHVLSYWGYDEVSRYAGPLVADAAMGLATLALQRVAMAKRLARLATAPVGQVATEDVAKAEPLATVANEELADLATDWATLDDDLDAELAEMVATAKAEPEPTAEEPEAAPEPEPAEEDRKAEPEPTKDRAPVKLTGVPAEAAKRIQEALEADAKATAAAIARDLVAAGLADADRTGRRYVAAIKNGTARVS